MNNQEDLYKSWKDISKTKQSKIVDDLSNRKFSQPDQNVIKQFPSAKKNQSVKRVKQTFDDIKYEQEILMQKKNKGQTMTIGFARNSKYFFTKRNRHQPIDPTLIPNSKNSLRPMDYSEPDRNRSKKRWDFCTTGKIEDGFSKIVASSHPLNNAQ